MRPRSIAAVAALALMPACPEATADAPPISDIAAPTLDAIVPGGSLAIAWTATSAFDPLALRVTLVPRIPGAAVTLIEGATQAASTTAPTTAGFTWGGDDLHGLAVRPGYYGIAVDDLDTSRRYDGGDRNIIVVTGASFTAPAAGASIAVTTGTPTTLAFETSTIGTLTMTLIADPSPPDGDELVIASLPIPGEIRTIGRDYAWDGTTMTGATAAPGDYAIAAILDDGTTTWRVEGGTAHVTAP